MGVHARAASPSWGVRAHAASPSLPRRRVGDLVVARDGGPRELGEEIRLGLREMTKRCA